MCSKNLGCTSLSFMAKKCSRINPCTVKPVLSRHSKRPKLVFQTNYHLMQVKSIAEHSAIPSTCIKLPFCHKDRCLTIFEWPLKTGFTVCLIRISILLDYLEAFRCECVNEIIIFLFINQNIYCGYSKNRINETALLSTQNTCLN